jgi:dihydroorotase-like cyclic amidohydrolase
MRRTRRSCAPPEADEAAGRIDAMAHLAARPAVAEIEAIGRVLTLAEWTGARVHIAHHSAADSLFLLREAKRRGVDVTAETCPQYLLLNTDHMLKLGGVMRLNPPIREARHNQPLWDALMDGTLDMIATDHAPHTPEEKTRESIWDCDCGFPGVETQMPLMLTEVNRGRATLMDYVRWSAVNPAKAWGLYGTKGVIAPGAHADIAIVDMAARGHAVAEQAAEHQQDLAVERPRGAGLPAAHAAARALRDARRQAGERRGRLGPFGEGRAEDADARSRATPSTTAAPSCRRRRRAATAVPVGRGGLERA